MSGYEQSPDYGGRDPGPWDWVGPLCVMLAITAVMFACNQRARAADTHLIGRASVIDGDTIEMHGQRIRLWGIDAPERGQFCTDADGAAVRAGQPAAMALSDMTAAKTLTCTNKGHDRYQRMLAVCRVGATDINQAMVEQGWALAYRHYSNDYAAAEAPARRSERGMWAWTCDAPWDWRKERRSPRN